MALQAWLIPAYNGITAGAERKIFGGESPGSLLPASKLFHRLSQKHVGAILLAALWAVVWNRPGASS